MDNHSRQLHAVAEKPVRISSKGLVFVGDEEFAYPIVDGSIVVERAHRNSRCNKLTVTLLVGEVTIERNES